MMRLHDDDDDDTVISGKSKKSYNKPYAEWLDDDIMSLAGGKFP